ncbi:hypothetical protein, partial [Enterococcus florum]|uniref:hypothetical protein n=1 Tax=Enterococcus florum TaxID=2480627 RepID=UPI001D1319B8
FQRSTYYCFVSATFISYQLAWKKSTLFFKKVSKELSFRNNYVNLSFSSRFVNSFPQKMKSIALYAKRNTFGVFLN